MSILIDRLLIHNNGNKIIFSGYLKEKFFFGAKENGKIEVINDYIFYDFEIEYIIKHLKEKI